MTNEEQERKLLEIIENCENIENVPFTKVIEDSMKDAVWLLYYLLVEEMGAGFKEGLEKYKNDFENFKDDMKAAGAETSKYYKELERQLITELKERFVELKLQIQDLIKTASTLPACFANPFTITAGFPIFFSLLAQYHNIARILAAIARFILDNKLHRLDDYKELVPGIEKVDSIVDTFINLSQPFTVLGKIIGTIDSIVNSLIGKDNREKLNSKMNDASDLLTAIQNLSNQRNVENFCGYLFECVNFNSTFFDEDGNEVTKQKTYQYVGCNTLIKTNQTDIECTKDLGDFTRDDILEHNPILARFIGTYQTESSLLNSGIYYIETKNSNWLNTDNWMEI